MGKRNKFSKIGISKKTYNSLLRAKKKNMNNTTMLNQTHVEEIGSDQEISDNDMDTSNLMNTTSNKFNKTKLLNTTSNNLNKSIINEDLVNRQSSLLGIDKKILMAACENPIRHRRQITKIVLSKGQKKRQAKKEKFKKREELVEKIKLNNSMINQSMLNKTSLTVNKIKAPEKKDGFNLGDIDNTLGNLLDELQQSKEDEKIVQNVKFSNTHRNKRNLKKILQGEKEKIKKVIDNKNYQSNPLEAMKFHIKNAQLINERNKKIEENFQKNYNFLNIKK
jgi:hypothetical protein